MQQPLLSRQHAAVAAVTPACSSRCVTTACSGVLNSWGVGDAICIAPAAAGSLTACSVHGAWMVVPAGMQPRYCSRETRWPQRAPTRMWPKGAHCVPQQQPEHPNHGAGAFPCFFTCCCAFAHAAHTPLTSVHIPLYPVLYPSGPPCAWRWLVQSHCQMTQRVTS